MQAAFPFVDISTGIDALAAMITPDNPAAARTGLQVRRDIHPHALGCDARDGVNFCGLRFINPEPLRDSRGRSPPAS